MKRRFSFLLFIFILIFLRENEAKKRKFKEKRRIKTSNTSGNSEGPEQKELSTIVSESVNEDEDKDEGKDKDKEPIISDDFRLLLKEKLEIEPTFDKELIQNGIKTLKRGIKDKPVIVSSASQKDPESDSDTDKESTEEDQSKNPNKETKLDRDQDFKPYDYTSTSSAPSKSLSGVTSTESNTSNSSSNSKTIPYESDESPSISENNSSVPLIAEPAPITTNNDITTGPSFNYNGGDNDDLSFGDNNDLSFDDNGHDNHNDIVEKDVTVPPEQKLDDPSCQIPTKNVIIPTEKIIPKVIENDRKSNNQDIDSVLQAGNILPSITGLFSENQKYFEEEDFDNMKNILSNLQIVLFYLAGVTFLAILLYSVYYINLIRRIYTKKVSGFKWRTSGGNHS